MIFDLHGSFAPVFTPLDNNGRINYKIFPEYMRYLNKNKISGILVGGTTGEAMSLSVDERKELLEAWLAAARPHGVKVIAQVGGAPLPDVQNLAQHAEHVAADAIMTLPELYYKPKTVGQLVGYLEGVSLAAPSLPLIYYHFPMMTGVDFHMPDLFSEAVAKIPNFQGMKADLGVAIQLTDRLVEGQKIFIANHQIAPSVLMGHDSSIATVTNIFPVLMQDIIDAVNSSNVLKARSQQERMNKLMNTIASQGDFVPAMKSAMTTVTGVNVGPPRPPLYALNQDRRTTLVENLKSLGIQTFD